MIKNWQTKAQDMLQARQQELDPSGRQQLESAVHSFQLITDCTESKSQLVWDKIFICGSGSNIRGIALVHDGERIDKATLFL